VHLVLLFGEPPSELRARAQTELRIRRAEVLLDRLRREEELRRGGLVGDALCNDERDLELLWGQSRDVGIAAAPDALTGRAKLRGGRLRPGKRTQPLERRQRRVELVARVAAKTGATQPLAVRQGRPCLQERLPRALVPRKGVLESRGVVVLPGSKCPQMGGTRLRPRP